MIVAVLGSSGFVGEEIVSTLLARGHEVRRVTAPRILAEELREGDVLKEALTFHNESVSELREQLSGVGVVINAAGVARPGSALSSGLVGANSILPGLVVRAAAFVPGRRVVHVSSAAVYGDVRVVNPASLPVPCSPYGLSKLWGEHSAVQASDLFGVSLIIYRPTSVHGDGRRVTEMVRRLAKSSFATVAAPGTDPTPQTTVSSVAMLAVDLASLCDVKNRMVDHPWEGWTTSTFLTSMGDGHRPIQIPRSLARFLLVIIKTIGRLDSMVAANARRLEILWFGQEYIVNHEK